MSARGSANCRPPSIFWRTTGSRREAGTLAPIEVTRAEAQVYVSQQDLLVSQTNLLQQETVLKNAISRNGIANSTLIDAHVIPLDTITIPARDETPPVNQLVEKALANRSEIAQSRLNIDSDKLNLVGIKNALKPTLQAFAELTNNGLTGTLTPVGEQTPGVPYLAGGYGNLLGEMFRRNFPNYSAGIALNIPLRNRAAQSDYVTSELELRQNELGLQQNINQVRVDVQNAVIGLQQARARYAAAIKASALQQQTLEADQKRLALGASTAYQVVLDQQNVASAESSQVQALANYSHARIGLDQALGRTLEANNITFDEALGGTISRPSQLPATLPRTCIHESTADEKRISAKRTCAVCATRLASTLRPRRRPWSPVRSSALRSPTVGRITAPLAIPPVRLENSGRLRQPGASRHALPDRAGCHCAGAREQYRHRGGALQPDPGRVATGALPRWRSVAWSAERRVSGR